MKWPIRNKKETIWIIHDNAKPHVSPTDPDVVQAGRNKFNLCQFKKKN
jgi:hypothetical protein